MAAILMLFGSGCGTSNAASIQPAPALLASSGPTTPEPRGDAILSISGLVATALNLSYEEVTALTAVRVEAVLYCPGVYENQPTREWYGVPVSALLSGAGLKTEASRVVFSAADGYMTTLSLEKINASGAILAYRVDGADLSKADGYPLRLVSNDLIGDIWIRWVSRIEVV